jgi:hypothetical protein
MPVGEEYSTVLLRGSQTGGIEKREHNRNNRGNTEKASAYM